jgi:hypothetical protein
VVDVGKEIKGELQHFSNIMKFVTFLCDVTREADAVPLCPAPMKRDHNSLSSPEKENVYKLEDSEDENDVPKPLDDVPMLLDDVEETDTKGAGPCQSYCFPC